MQLQKMKVTLNSVNTSYVWNAFYACTVKLYFIEQKAHGQNIFLLVLVIIFIIIAKLGLLQGTSLASLTHCLPSRLHNATWIRNLQPVDNDLNENCLC